MSPAAVRPTSRDSFEDDLDLSIIGIGVQYPPYRNGPEALETLAKRYYPESTAMKKVLSINRFTGIETRSAFGDASHPAVNRPNPPSIRELNTLFMDIGVSLATSACSQALQDANVLPEDITHMVSTTCTNSANPGYDHFVAKNLGLSSSLEKVLLHGIGCSGGLAAIRTACNLALGMKARRRPAKVLVCATEVSSLLVRSELESIDRNQEVRIGVCLFSDCSSACVVSNGVGDEEQEERGSVYDVLGWKHELIPDSAHELGFDVDPLGWKVVLTPRVPSLTSAALPPAFHDLASSIPSLPSTAATDFDWAIHPGGATILTGAQNVLSLTEEHLRCSYEVYMQHGNSSSATILSVLKRERSRGQNSDGDNSKNEVIAAAFGPGVTLELMMLRRGRRGGAERMPDLVNGSNGTTNGESTANGVNGVHENTSNGVETKTNGVGHANGANGMNGSMAANGLHAADGIEPVIVNGEALAAEELD